MMEKSPYQKARKKVDEKKAFFKHLFTWLIFSVFFLILNFSSPANTFWAIYPIAGWGLGVLLQAVKIYGFPGLGKDWERKQLEEELERIEREEQLKSRYLYLKEKQEHNILDELEERDLKTLSKVKRYWDDDDLV